MVPQRRPAPDVVPVEPALRHCDEPGVFHDRVINRNFRLIPEEFRKFLLKSSGCNRFADLGAEPFQSGRLAAEFRPQRPDLSEKDSAVPAVVSGGEETFGGLPVRFLPETEAPEETGPVRSLFQRFSALDVTISGCRRGGRNADREQPFGVFPGQFRSILQHCRKFSGVLDHMVGREHHHDRAVAAARTDQRRGQSGTGPGVATDRFSDDVPHREIRQQGPDDIDIFRERMGSAIFIIAPTV